MRVLAWIVIAFVLVVALVLNLERIGVGAEVREGLFTHHGGGRGFDDGKLVWSQDTPERITIEELPSLEGRLRGQRSGGDFVAEEMSWYGVSLRECIGHCLGLAPRHVDGDPSLDEIWLDVDASRVAAGLAGSDGSWDAVRERVLTAVLDVYGLELEQGTARREVVVLSAGPRWAGLLVEREARPSELRRRRGRLIAQQAPVDDLLDRLGRELDFDMIDGFDPDTRCEFMLQWHPDLLGDFERALAETCDVRLVTELREAPGALVTGRPVSPVTWKPEDRGPPR